jgi:hypothetical protein
VGGGERRAHLGYATLVHDLHMELIQVDGTTVYRHQTWVMLYTFGETEIVVSRVEPGFIQRRHKLGMRSLTLSVDGMTGHREWVLILHIGRVNQWL